MAQTDIKEILPPDAWKLMNDDPSAVLVDCRSTMEYNYVGHPTVSQHIPWSEPPDWTININFAENVKAALESLPNTSPLEDQTIMVLCRSGVRSLAAGRVLLEAGFKNVYNVLEGFEGPIDTEQHRGAVGGWRYHGLPWTQS